MTTLTIFDNQGKTSPNLSLKGVMSLDHNLFYREITRQIFSHLAIEDALHAGLIELKKVIPGDLLILQYSNLEAGVHKIIATATEKEGKKVDITIPFTPSARKLAVERTRQVSHSQMPVVLCNHTEEDEDIRIVRDYFQLGDSSLLLMALDIGGKLVGSLALFADGHDRYIDKHAEVFLLLKEPASIVLVSSYLYGENLKLTEMLKDDNRFLYRELQKISDGNIIGEEFGLKEVMNLVRQVAMHDSPVMLLGESGTGKDLIANVIHRVSLRENGPFITVNCGAIPDTLLDSELFGHEKGAFTGAISQKRGRFERANDGTIFLDEIGELPLQAQVRLLRVLQNKEIERVGGTRSLPVNIRVIAATNRDLEKMVMEGRFREDLWFRLNVFPINIPPLRQRKVDIPALVEHFIERKSLELKVRPVPKIDEDTLKRLEDYHWPGNVRELENVIERALIINPTGPLTFENLNPGRSKTPLETKRKTEETENLDEIITRHILQVLSRTRGKIHGRDGAAAFLGVNPSTLRNRMKKLGITYGKKVNLE